MHGMRAYEADLEKTVWTDAALMQADFRHARLGYASFERADCSGADFSQAALVYARFDYALLERTVFSGASFEYTSMHGVSGTDPWLAVKPGVASVDQALRDAELHALRMRSEI